jgi:hypothetical protein
MFFQTKLTDAQKQTTYLQNQLTDIKNSTITSQRQVDDLKTQLNSLQNPIYNVTIENITSTAWGVLGGLTVDKGFSITIKNTGVRDVGGLTFEFNILDNGTVWKSQDYEVGLTGPLQLGVLHVQESVVINARILSSVGVSFGGKTFEIIMLLDNTILDERSVVLESGYG